VLAGIRLAVKPFQQGLNHWDPGYCFQLLGYDFQVDEDLNVLLLEINTSPALDVPLPVLSAKQTMLKDLFCLIGEADGCERPSGTEQEIFVRERKNMQMTGWSPAYPTVERKSWPTGIDGVYLDFEEL
jgi:hypothetical protein